MQCYNNFPSWTPSQYDNYLHLFDLEIAPIDWWRKHLDNIEMYLNKHEKGIKNTTIHILYLTFFIMIIKYTKTSTRMKIDRSNLSRSCFMSNCFSVDTWNSGKIHILAAPQYKPRADTQKKSGGLFSDFYGIQYFYITK